MVVGQTVIEKAKQAKTVQTQPQIHEPTVPAASPAPLVSKVGAFAVRLCVRMIRGYQLVSRVTPPSCRFYPSCSEYTAQALQTHGFGRGLWLGVCRVCRCHPFHKGGYDPVPATPPVSNPAFSEPTASHTP